MQRRAICSLAVFKHQETTSQLSCELLVLVTGEGNVTPLQCSCLENPMDGIPGTGEPGGLLSMGLHRVGHDQSDLAAAAECHFVKLGGCQLQWIKI